MNTVTLKIDGMTCAGCVRSVKRVLEGVPGVRSAEVSLEVGQATVELDPALACGDPVAALKAAVEAAGYEAP
jgi:copper chaperone